MISSRQFVNLCFRYKPKAGENADQLNIQVQKRLMQKGQAYINYTDVKGVTVLLLNVVNPLVGEEDPDRYDIAETAQHPYLRCSTSYQLKFLPSLSKSSKP